ncbi:MAG: hypothetical protein M3512_13355 [Bacteroidota bacterium]|nr:hypothetical protein [Bacteroidota bacterium]
MKHVFYLKWILEDAQGHWLHLTDDELRSKYHWVVLRNEVDYFKGAVLNDQLKVVTWVDWHEGAKSLWKVKFFRENHLGGFFLPDGELPNRQMKLVRGFCFALRHKLPGVPGTPVPGPLFVSTGFCSPALLDANTKKPKRIEEDITGLFV